MCEFFGPGKAAKISERHGSGDWAEEEDREDIDPDRRWDNYVIGGLEAGIRWKDFWNHDYYEVCLHVKAYQNRLEKNLEVAAFQVMHLYRAFTGDKVTVDELLGRGQRIDLVNDPMALEKLRATHG